jgi:hypothetical protein
MHVMRRLNIEATQLGNSVICRKTLRMTNFPMDHWWILSRSADYGMVSEHVPRHGFSAGAHRE